MWNAIFVKIFILTYSTFLLLPMKFLLPTENCFILHRNINDYYEPLSAKGYRAVIKMTPLSSCWLPIRQLLAVITQHLHKIRKHSSSTTCTMSRFIIEYFNDSNHRTTRGSLKCKLSHIDSFCYWKRYSISWSYHCATSFRHTNSQLNWSE